MIITVGQLITLALDTIGAINVEEGGSPAELTGGLKRLNLMLDAWSVDGLMVPGTLMESFPLTAGKNAYTIGIGGDFNTPKPSAITDAFIRDGNGLDSGLDLVSMDEWNGYEDKDSDGRPTSLWYDEGPPQQAVQTGVIWLYPAPDAGAYTLYLGQQKPLTEFANLTDVVSFQTAYHEAILYNLALRLYRSYFKHSRPIPQDVIELAKESKRVVERMNAERVHMASDVPGSKGRYNIQTDR
jgi:hypothetical protein